MVRECQPGLRIGVDLGGTKIEAVALDVEGREKARERIATPRGDYLATVAAIAGLVARLEAAVGTTATVGVGIPGSISPGTGRIQNANSTWLNGRHLDRDLAAALARPVRLANDANCFALSEATDGAAAAAPSVLGVILGTGVGGGVVVCGRIVDGPRGTGGEWGHNPLPWAEAGEMPGPACWCGRNGCIEAWVSGPGLAADHARATGEALSAEAVVAAAVAGDTGAGTTLDRHAGRLARGLAHVVNILDPHVIVLGGGLSRLEYLYERLPALMAPHLFTDNAVADIRPPVWGDASGVRGAAWLWDDGAPQARRTR